MLVENEVYYHISLNVIQKPKKEWEIGSKDLIGELKNPFFKIYDSKAITVTNSSNNEIYDINYLGKYFQGILIEQKELIFNHENKDVYILLVHALEHNLRFVREVIFEEVRKESFPHLPSRQRGIWVIPKDENLLKYWWNRISDGNKYSGKIIEFRLTGTIHKADDVFTNITTRDHDYIREQALNYWGGKIESGYYELLFEGEAEVINIIEAKEFGID